MKIELTPESLTSLRMALEIMRNTIAATSNELETQIVLAVKLEQEEQKKKKEEQK